jgi:ubiquinone/menaquinone biosynthesis C-methylase UbiE
MSTTRFLSHDQAARFYDFLGAGLDTQAFYETAALRDLVTHLELATCQYVVEYGFGTGRLAAELLSAYLPPEARYFGLDVSATMTSLAKRRLRVFGRWAEVRLCDGAPRVDATDGSFDRFISTYVLDLLSDDDIREVLKEARRVLKPSGMLGLVSLTNGPTPFSRTLSIMWRGLHRMSPWLVGGCRPIEIRSFISNSEWHIEYANIVVSFGVPSEIVVARPVS